MLQKRRIDFHCSHFSHTWIDYSDNSCMLCYHGDLIYTSLIHLINAAATWCPERSSQVDAYSQALQKVQLASVGEISVISYYGFTLASWSYEIFCAISHRLQRTCNAWALLFRSSILYGWNLLLVILVIIWQDRPWIGNDRRLPIKKKKDCSEIYVIDNHNYTIFANRWLNRNYSQGPTVHQLDNWSFSLNGDDWDIFRWGGDSCSILYFWSNWWGIVHCLNERITYSLHCTCREKRGII